MNVVSRERRSDVLWALVEGASSRVKCRITGTARDTLLYLLEDAGAGCLDYQDKTLHDFPCKRLQCNEIWSFCQSKQKNVPEEQAGEFGFEDVWTWTARLCP